MKNIGNILEDISIVFGVTIGLSQIQTILGIIVLAFQVGLIIYKLVRNILKRLKNNDYDGIEKDVNDAIDNLNDISKKQDGK